MSVDVTAKDHPVDETEGFAPGAQVIVRDERWLIRTATMTRDGWMLKVTGVSDFVRDTEAVFYSGLDVIQPLDPKATRLIPDDSPNHRRARLYLEAVVRKSFLPQTEHGLAFDDHFLMDRQVHQLRPAMLALSMENPQPRLLIADVVGLGKTLEIGILLAELIRRGRGERILVVTPQHVLEQFQRELWTRFGIPLVRLDSTGIQRVQQEIPSGRNPFAYFKRVIVSVDTLKNENLYRHHLENTTWDAVVIDESHNLITRGSQRNELAKTLAPRTDALILASATPHNGDAKSFAELIRLLDPAAIADTGRYDIKDLDHLYIRRTKTTPEVRDSLKGAWADRGPSIPVHAAAGAKEEAVFAELIARWMPVDGSPTAAPKNNQLFPYTLLKSFLSSHVALKATVDTRLKTIKDRQDAATVTERAALEHLGGLAEDIRDDDSAKFRALVAELRALGVGPGSDTRVVVFSERIPTLRWLSTAVPQALGFAEAAESPDKVRPWLAFGGAVQVMHGETSSDQEQMAIVEKFGLRDDPVRLLFTGDVASEGVNLHQQCHLLIHYDLPWSLIRIEQRNGRIDRYGQRHSPKFRALVLTSELPWKPNRSLDDRLVGERLLAREAEAHKIEGSADAVTGLYRADEEERRLIKDLIAGKTVEQSLTDSRQSAAGFLGDLLAQVGAAPQHAQIPRAAIPTLFDSTQDYFDQALREVFTNAADDLQLRREDNGTIAFEPPRDLAYRFKSLPASYLSEQNILGAKDRPGRLRVTFSKELAQSRLAAARDRSDTLWPNVSYLTDIHPVMEWIMDKVLVRIGQHEAPVLAAKVDEPVFLVQGMYSNTLGRPLVVEWMAVTGSGPGDLRVEPMVEALARGGVGAGMPGRSLPNDLPGLQAMVPAAIDTAAAWLERRSGDYDAAIAETLAPYKKRLVWRQDELYAIKGAQEKRTQGSALARRRELVKSLTTKGRPMLRLLAVLEGNQS
ncbi:SNF2-related protein [Embleya sp. NPDC055664]